VRRPADDPTRWLRRACASAPHVPKYAPVRFSARLRHRPGLSADFRRPLQQ